MVKGFRVRVRARVWLEVKWSEVGVGWGEVGVGYIGQCLFGLRDELVPPLSIEPLSLAVVGLGRRI